jgi:hypothetical protein
MVVTSSDADSLVRTIGEPHPGRTVSAKIMDHTVARLLMMGSLFPNVRDTEFQYADWIDGREIVISREASTAAQRLA